MSRAREACLHVGHVRVAFTADDYAAIPETNVRFSALRGSGLLDDGADDADHHPSVRPAEEDVAVRKTRTGAFSTTDLEALLRDRGIDTLILAGVSASGVILSTARKP